MDGRFPELVTGSVAAMRQRLVDFEPGHVVVMTPDDASENWVRRCLVDISPLIGVEVTNPGSFVNESAAAAFGEPIPETSILSLMRECFADRPMFRELFVDGMDGGVPAKRDSTAARSWLKGLQQQFVEMHRVLGDGENYRTDLSGFTARDRELFEGFLAFRDRLKQACPDGWWSGTAPSAALRASVTLPALRDLRAVFLFGFSTDGRDGDLARKPVWLNGFLNALCNPEGRASIPVIEMSVSPVGERCAAPQLRACQNPEAEIAEIARMIRAARTDAAVFVPADEVGRWTARLLHRDIPVRARVPRPMAETAVLRMLRALVQVAGGGLIHKSDMTEVLFSPVLRAVNWGIRQGEPDNIEHPAIYPTVRSAWQEIRRRNRTLEGWLQQIDLLAERRLARWAEADADDTPSDSQLERRTVELNAIEVLKKCVLTLQAGVRSPDSIRTLLIDWRLRPSSRAAAAWSPHEVRAAEGLLLALEETRDRVEPLPHLLASIYEDMNLRRTGYWVDHHVPDNGCDAGSARAVMLLPYQAACVDLPRLVFLCGLDAVPATVSAPSLFSDAALNSIGVASESDRHACECARLNRLVSGAARVLSWRTRDAQGGATTASGWTMNTFPETTDPLARPDRFRIVGIDAVAAPAPDSTAASALATPTCRLEQDVMSPSGVLKSRVAAILTHYTPETPGPWCGELGVSFRPDYYSVSALQQYNRMPYSFFLRRVLGLADDEADDDSLDSAEQGTLLHAALEVFVKSQLAMAGGANAVKLPLEEVQRQTASLLNANFERECGGVLADQVWKGDSARWQAELNLWWQGVRERAAMPVTVPVPVQAENDASGAAAGDDKAGSATKPPSGACCDKPGSVLVAAELKLGTSSQPLQIKLTEDLSIPVKGSVDLVEYDPDLDRINICDYKSGEPKASTALSAEIKKGLHLQLPLYAVAVDALDLAAKPGCGSAQVGAFRLEFLKRARNKKLPNPAALSTDGTVGESSLTHVDIARRHAARIVDCLGRGIFPLTACTQRVADKSRESRVMRVVLVAEPPSILDVSDAHSDGDDCDGEVTK